MSAHERAVEAAEVVAKMRASGFAPLVRALSEEPECFTASGRINCSAVARHLGISQHQAGRMLIAVREMQPSYF